MTITRQFYKAYNFAYSQCVGSIDDHDLHIHVLSFQVESKGMTFVREVLDFRQLHSADRLTVQGMIEICELERKRSDDRDFRLAIIANQPLFEQIARIYAQVIGTQNLHVKVFREDIGLALTWLGYDPPRMKKLKRFMSKHRKVIDSHPI